MRNFLLNIFSYQDLNQIMIYIIIMIIEIMSDPQFSPTRSPWEGGINLDPTIRAKVVYTLVVPPADGRLKSLAVYQSTTHPKEFCWSEDKVIT